MFMTHCLHDIPMCLRVHGPIFCILPAVHNPATQKKLTHMPSHVSQESACTSDPSNQPSVHAGVGPFPASAVHTFCRTARVHSHPTLTKRGQTQRMSSGQLRRLFRWSLWLALASMPRYMAHSTAQLPGASVSCALWPSLVISALPGRDPFSNPFQEIMCQVILCTFLR